MPKDKKILKVVNPDTIQIDPKNPLVGVQYWQPGEDLINWSFKQAGIALNALLEIGLNAESNKDRIAALKEFLARPMPVNQTIELRPMSESPIDRLNENEAKEYLDKILQMKQIEDKKGVPE